VSVGRYWRNGCYELTLVVDAEDCDNIAAMFPANDRGADEFTRAADEIRLREAARLETAQNSPGLRVVVVDTRSAGGSR
jgi:hypothetical protein